VPNIPVIGSGPDTFEFAFPDDAQGFLDASFDTAHNEYIQILVTHGILGLLSYLVFLGGVLLTSVKYAFKNPILMAVLAAFTGYLVQAFFNISLPIVSMALWLFAGILASRRVREMQWV
jgi:putative inorganic carbon (HCO3(-)) transporter